MPKRHRRCDDGQVANRGGRSRENLSPAQSRKIVDFGAFVEILPGTEGLLHISQIAKERINKVTELLQEGR